MIVGEPSLEMTLLEESPTLIFWAADGVIESDLDMTEFKSGVSTTCEEHPAKTKILTKKALFET